jgi:hypothetical protein
MKNPVRGRLSERGFARKDAEARTGAIPSG